MSDFVTHRRRITAPVQEIERDGRAYLVAPTVAVVEGVLNGELVLAEEIGRWPTAWEDVPVPAGHPQVNGLHVSARTADQVGRAAGRLYGVVMDGPSLKGSIWLDVARAEALGGDAALVLQMLRDGQPVEVSTGYFRDLEETPGDWAGVPYRGIQRNIVPDHLALLPGQVGACSWADGCGVPRVNEREQPAIEPDQPNGGAESMDNELEVQEPCTECPEEAPAVNEAPIEPDLSTAEPDVALAPAISPELEALAEVVAEFGGVDAFKQALRQFKANEETERASLVESLAANQRNAFSRDDLKGMTTAQLRKLDISLKPADFSGRGLPNARNQRSEWAPYVAPQ